MLDVAACNQNREYDHQSNSHDPPMSRAADDADAGREPGTCSTGQSVNPQIVLCVNDHTGPEKTDARENTLNDPAGGIGDLGSVATGADKQEDRRRGEADQAERS